MGWTNYSHSVKDFPSLHLIFHYILAIPFRSTYHLNRIALSSYPPDPIPQQQLCTTSPNGISFGDTCSQFSLDPFCF